MSARGRSLFRIAGFAAIACLSLNLNARAARAEEPPLSRARVIELARAAPSSRVAASEAAVAGAAVDAAGVLALDNPVVSGMGGLRFNPDGTKPLAAQATLSWPVELGGQRGARVDAAKAEERAAVSAAEDTQRKLLLAALLQHAIVLREERQIAIAAERRALAGRLAATAGKRRQAGGVPEIDVALATLQEKRDEAAEAAAIGARDASKLALASLLGLPSMSVAVAGELVPPGEPPTLDALLHDAPQRTDVRAAHASLEAARARAARERAARWPTVSILAQYERDDDANIGLLGLSVPIPILNANRAAAATTAAEVDAAKARAEASRVAATGQIRQLYARYLATKKALAALAPAAGLAAQAVALSVRGYELGENDLASVLLVRREANDTKAALLDAELAHANAKIELLVAAGRSPQ